MSRTAWLILALCGVLAWFVGRAWLAGEADPAASAPAAAGDRKSSKKDKGISAADIPVVVSLHSQVQVGEAFARERSLFSFAKSPEEIQKIEDERRAREEAARQAAQAAAEAAAARQVEAAAQRKLADERAAAELAARQAYERDHPPKPTPPTFPYQYVGTIGPTEDPFAILAGVDRQFRYARVGEVIDSKFQLEFIGEARLDLSYTDDRFSDQFAQISKYDAGTPAPPAKR